MFRENSFGGTSKKEVKCIKKLGFYTLQVLPILVSILMVVSFISLMNDQSVKYLLIVGTLLLIVQEIVKRRILGKEQEQELEEWKGSNKSYILLEKISSYFSRVSLTFILIGILVLWSQGRL